MVMLDRNPAVEGFDQLLLQQAANGGTKRKGSLQPDMHCRANDGLLAAARFKTLVRLRL